MKEVRHIGASIAGLLNLSNYRLGKVLDMNGSVARKELLERQAKGEKYIPSDQCDNFDPLTGCKGHKITEP